MESLPKTRSWFETQFYSPRARRATIPFILFVGILSSIYAFLFLEREYGKEQENVFSRISYTASSTFMNHAQQLDTSILSIAGFFRASEYVDAVEFHYFVEPLLRHHGYPLKYFAWIPVRSDPSDNSKSSRPDLPPMATSHPADYVPAYVEPATALVDLKDQNWRTHPVLNPLLVLARKENKMVFSGCLTRAMNNKDKCRSIVVFPIFDRRAIPSHTNALMPPQTGFIAAGLDLSTWMWEMMSPEVKEKLDFDLIDDTDPVRTMLLFRSKDRWRTTAPGLKVGFFPHSNSSQQTLRQSITLGLNHWQLITRTAPGRPLSHSFLPVFVLLTGLTVTALLTVYLYGMARLFRRLAKEKAFSERLFDVGLSGKLVVDRNLRITLCNTILAPLLGRMETGIVGRSLCEIEALANLEGLEERCVRAMDKGSEEFMSQVAWMPSGQGDGTFFDIYATPIYDGMGLRTGCLIVFHNVSDHVRMNRQLRLDKDMTRQYLDMADTIIIVLDAKGDIQFINQKGLGILGYDLPDLMGKNLIDHMLPEHWRSDMKKSQDRILERKYNKSYSVHTQVYTKSGALRTISWKIGLLAKDGENGSGLLCVGEDVTLQVRTEDRLRRSEARFRMMASTAQDAIIEVNKDCTIQFWNTAAEKMFGYPDQEALGRNLHQLVAPAPMVAHANAAFVNFFQNKKTSEPGRIIQLTARNKTGEEFPVELSISLMDHRGSDHRVVGIVRDITERKRAEEQHRFASFQAGVAEMSVSILHNIGNAMMSLIGRSDDIIRHGKELERLADLFARVRPMVDEQTSKGMDPDSLLRRLVAVADEMSGELKTVATQGLKTNALHLRDAAEHVREIIRIQQESSHYTLREKFVLKDLIDDCRVILLDLLTRDQIQLTYRSGLGVNEVVLPRGQMLQMMINLVKNSCEAITDPRHDLSQPGRIDILSRYVDSSWLEIIVEDNGIGMDEQAKNNIFASGYSSKDRGTGFGLHSVANFVQHLGGRITGSSDGPGLGARFVVSLPIMPKSYEN
ncbi:MAG: PAS domain S-box protein [Magnetococcales bacterium]|nr:PAS domain S-box protein [Magnetococcales bacterium]